MTLYAKIKPHLTPLNIFNIILLIVVIISGAILFMVMVGMIRFEEPQKQEWFEVNAQILNACFTITALMTQPQRLLLFVWTVRWYKAEGSKKREYARMIEEIVPAIVLYSRESDTTVDTLEATEESLQVPPKEYQTPPWKWYTILALLNGQCIFQYPITYVQWAWIGKALERPQWVIAVFLPLSFLCGAISGIWPMLIQRKRKQKAKAAQLQ